MPRDKRVISKWLFHHGVAGGDTAEHDALADIARALVHVAQIEPNSPAEYRFSIGLLPCLHRDTRRKHDRRCDYNSFHNRDAVRKPGKLFIAAAP